MKREKPMEWTAARALLLAAVSPVGTETVTLPECAGRVLAEDAAAKEDVPAFDRSPYDGYAFRAADSLGASEAEPVVLRILEEVPAGAVPTLPVTAGTATKVLTGAPVPPGADAVINYEATEFTPMTVTLRTGVKPGSNIVRRGEDVRAGAVLLRAGRPIDAGGAGVLAAQGIYAPTVDRRPRVAILSTGSELVEADAAEVGPGKIRNSNACMLSAALGLRGFVPVYLGIAGDDAEAIRAKLEQGLDSCDAVVCTGGVSVGDYDLTPDAMERAGVQMLLRGVALKPGMACAYGVRGGKPVCALSGNPASSLTNFYALALPALLRLAGRADAVPEELTLTLKSAFPKPSRGVRLLRGRLDLTGGRAELALPAGQGNVVLSSAVDADAMAIVPAGSGPLAAGTQLRGFRI